MKATTKQEEKKIPAHLMAPMERRITEAFEKKRLQESQSEKKEQSK